jgi:hypothetical protein
MNDRQKAEKLANINLSSNQKSITAYEHAHPELKMQRKLMQKHNQVFRTGAGPAVQTGGPQ